VEYANQAPRNEDTILAAMASWPNADTNKSNIAMRNLIMHPSDFEKSTSTFFNSDEYIGATAVGSGKTSWNRESTAKSLEIGQFPTKTLRRFSQGNPISCPGVFARLRFE
jgi:hypothetical protein